MNSIEEIIEQTKIYLAPGGGPVSVDLDISDTINYFTLKNDKLIATGFFDEKTLEFSIGIDNKKCYNKYGQCPLFVREPLGKRKEKRLFSAIQILLTKEGAKASSEFSFKEYGFDDFGRY